MQQRNNQTNAGKQEGGGEEHWIRPDFWVKFFLHAGLQHVIADFAKTPITFFARV